MLIGIAGILGWIFDLPVLYSIIPGLKPIAVSAAIVFILFGGVEMLLAAPVQARALQRALLVVSGVLTLFGLLEVIELVTHTGVSLEDLVLRHYPALAANPLAHIAPVASVLVVLIGLAQSQYLLLRFSATPQRALPDSFGVLASVIVLISAMSLLGYLYGSPLLYQQLIIPISALAALAALLLGIGLIVLAGEESFPLNRFAGTSMRAQLLRAFLPLTALLLLLMSLFQFLIIRLELLHPVIAATILLTLFESIISIVILWLSRRIGKQIEQAVAERQRAEEALRELNETLEQRIRERTAQLEASLHEMETFSYSVAHDLRSPLRGIDGFSRYLLDHYADRLDMRGQDYLQRMRVAAQRMGRLIDDLLTLARVGRMEVSREAVDLSALATEIITELHRRDPARQVHADVTPHMVVQADRELLRVALGHLLDNAWKFTSRREDAQIAVGVVIRADEPTYFVRDNGVGFDMAYVDKLFQPFQRLHTETEFPGTGIGLALTQRIIQRHGGRIWADSTPGQGTVFDFTLGEA